MKIIYNKFLIISTAILIIGGVYLYFSNNLMFKDVVPVAYGNSLSSSKIPEEALSSVSKQVSSDISFLNTLVSLKEIKIDKSLFSNKFFNSLNSNSVKIESVSAGRSNPFVSISNLNVSGNDIVSGVTTDQPTQITDKTVVFNGTINTTNNVSDVYFEYGVTENFGITTLMIKPSLIGTFVKEISGLNSKTNYFFRACAKINNLKSCGNIVSFTTN